MLLNRIWNSSFKKTERKKIRRKHYSNHSILYYNIIKFSSHTLLRSSVEYFNTGCALRCTIKEYMHILLYGLHQTSIEFYSSYVILLCLCNMVCPYTYIYDLAAYTTTYECMLFHFIVMLTGFSYRKVR